MAYSIIETCIGCTACVKKCPVNAITGVRDELHVIDPDLCIDCGACGAVCPPESILDELGDQCRTFPRRELPLAKVIDDNCIGSGCELCINVCPFDALELDLSGERVGDFFGTARVIDPAEVSAALVECRRMVEEEASRRRREAPGFEDAYISLMADQLGITESRRLQGRYVMVRDDMDRHFDDTIARTGHWTKYDCVYNVPYGSLLTRGTANLLAAGRCISVDHRVHHATKEIPACMATGQAAGIAAALAAGGA